jgi:hypothetical protein
MYAMGVYSTAELAGRVLGASEGNFCRPFTSLDELTSPQMCVKRLQTE